MLFGHGLIHNSNMRPFFPGQSLFNIIQSKLPDFVIAEYPAFVEYVTAFARFLEQPRITVPQTVYPEYGVAANSTVQVTQTLGGPVWEGRNLLVYRDADSALDEFKSHFLAMFGDGFPAFEYIPTGLLIDSLRQFYQNKGTVESVQWLFRVLFNEHADVYFPRNNILRASDGTWVAPLTLKVSSPTNDPRPNKDVSTYYVGQRVQTATGTAQVESVVTNIVGQSYNQNIIVNELTLKFGSVIGTFVAGQDLFNIDSPGNVVHTTILPVITSLIVESGGSNYAIGDLVNFSEGPGGGYGYGAFGTVAAISNSAIDGITIVDGGNGYIVGDPITFVSTTGTGAMAIVSNVVYGDILLENGNGYVNLEQLTPGDTNYATLEDEDVLLLELTIDSFCNATADVVIGADGIPPTDYGTESGVAQFDNVGIDSQIYIAFAAIDQKPFMIPWVFTNDAMTTASLANAAANLAFSAPNLALSYFSNGATIFSLVNLQDAVSNVSTANVTAMVIVADIAEGGLTGELFLQDFTGLNKFVPNMVMKETGNGTLQVGTITTDGTANVFGTNTVFTEVCQTGTHLRWFADGTQVVVNQVVNNTYLTTFGMSGVPETNTPFSVIPVGTVTSIIAQAQRYYGKIRAIQLLSSGIGYATPPALFVDSVDARAQELFYLDPDPYPPVDTTSSLNMIVMAADQISVYNVATLTAIQAAGEIVKVNIDNSGVNYQDANAIVITAIHGGSRTGLNAEFEAVIGALTQYPGEYTTTLGFLSADMFLEDSTYYNDYTYVIKVAESFNRYSAILLQLLHPAGFQPLGQFVEVDVAAFLAPQGTMEEEKRKPLPLSVLISDPTWGNGPSLPQLISTLIVTFDGITDI